MYRNIILEFLSTKHLVLSENAYFQMTLCEIGCSYNESPIKFVKKEDEINIYNIKEPRIYHKSYDYSHLESTIITMLMEIKNEITFNKSDLDFEMLDPYYLEDIRKIDFLSIQITPITKDDEIIGALIVYYNLENKKTKFTNNELVKLLNNLKNDRENDYLNSINDKIFKQNENYYLCIKGNNVYLNELLQKKFKFSSKIVNLKDKDVHKKVYGFINKHGVKKFKYEELSVHYIEKEKTIKPKVDDEILALHNINNHNLGENFSYIMIRKSPLSSIDKDLEQTIFWLNAFDDIIYKIYQLNDETIIIITDNVISKENIEHLKESLDDSYIVLINCGTDLNTSMDLKKISNYLYMIQPEKFIYQEYVDYLNKLSSEALSYQGKFKLDDTVYEAINVDNVTSLGKMYYLPLRENLRGSHFKSYTSAVQNELAILSKREEDQMIISVPFSLLQKRKILEDIKKIISNNNKLVINVINDYKIDSNTFTKVIAKYKKLNLLLSCDSSVYLNYYLMESLELFDFIYIQNEEYLHIRSHSVGLPQAIFSYVLHEYKGLLIENFKPDEDFDYNHPNCYYIKIRNK